MGAGYGCDANLHCGISARLFYIGGIAPNTTVWPPGTAPLPPKEWSGRGLRPKRVRRDPEHQPISVKALALGLPEDACQTNHPDESTYFMTE